MMMEIFGILMQIKYKFYDFKDKKNPSVKRKGFFWVGYSKLFPEKGYITLVLVTFLFPEVISFSPT